MSDYASLEELPPGHPTGQLQPTSAGQPCLVGCLDEDEQEKKAMDQEASILARLFNVEKHIQIRIEEDARMAERFDYIKERLDEQNTNIGNLIDKVEKIDDVTTKNNHDLNNGLKSAVQQNTSNVTKISRALQAHLNRVPTEDQRRQEIRELIIEEKERSGKRNHRTIEILAALITTIVLLGQFGFFTWIVDALGG